MGQHCCATRSQHEIDLESWREIPGHGNTVYKNPLTGEEIEEYPFATSSQEDYNNELLAFYLRYNHDHLVASRFLISQTQSELCSTVYKGKIYLQRVFVRLSNIKDVPYPDVLHLYDKAFRGFRELTQYRGFFSIQEDMICVNNQHEVKVWLNSNLSKSFPGTIQLSTEGEMLAEIIHKIDQNTHRNPESLHLSQYLASKSIGTFDEAITVLNEYANNNSTLIPHRLDCIKEIRDSKEAVIVSNRGNDIIIQPAQQVGLIEEVSHRHSHHIARNSQSSSKLFTGHQQNHPRFQSSRARELQFCHNAKSPAPHTLPVLPKSISSGRITGRVPVQPQGPPRIQSNRINQQAQLLQVSKTIVDCGLKKEENIEMVSSSLQIRPIFNLSPQKAKWGSSGHIISSPSPLQAASHQPHPLIAQQSTRPILKQQLALPRGQKVETANPHINHETTLHHDTLSISEKISGYAIDSPRKQNHQLDWSSSEDHQHPNDARISNILHALVPLHSNPYIKQSHKTLKPPVVQSESIFLDSPSKKSYADLLSTELENLIHTHEGRSPQKARPHPQQQMADKMKTSTVLLHESRTHSLPSLVKKNIVIERSKPVSPVDSESTSFEFHGFVGQNKLSTNLKESSNNQPLGATTFPQESPIHLEKLSQSPNKHDSFYQSTTAADSHAYFSESVEQKVSSHLVYFQEEIRGLANVFVATEGYKVTINNEILRDLQRLRGRTLMDGVSHEAPQRSLSKV